ncbi:ADP-ribose pyrophosphatase YjhB, NUDIX family [Paenibacillus sp. 1_12]|uniref:NUDIX hydrolase n=1 Tax=Paenibacillus sp. 1_12 TaxID=1566278 RepID=UPI0008ECE3DD|nr:NUDIX hydrolase [Paenibacillus sp. 1_12]SFL73822.1 ADP-ribose pyrophosphatase YjhB, NUDIX family [Paenibacillus sp. 1_12]
MDNYLLRVRVTGLLIEDGHILIVQQRVSSSRNWSLPGGKVERGEALDQALIREMKEETGLEVRVSKLLYVCDLPEADPSIIHISFLLERLSGEIVQPSNEFESTPIYEVRMVPIQALPEYGFSETFTNLVLNGFPEAGSYRGHKSQMGL